LKKNWTELSRERPGRRFQNRHRKQDRSGSGTSRALKLAAAIALLVGGAVLLVVPGPGSVLIVIGAALLAEESRIVARFMDRAEVRTRRWIRGAHAWWMRRRH
jgi:hypothetical protein